MKLEFETQQMNEISLAIHGFLINTGSIEKTLFSLLSPKTTMCMRNTCVHEACASLYAHECKCVYDRARTKATSTCRIQVIFF